MVFPHGESVVLLRIDSMIMVMVLVVLCIKYIYMHMILAMLCYRKGINGKELYWTTRWPGT